MERVLDSPTPKPFVSVREAAELLGMTQSGVYKLMTRGKLPAVRTSERGIRISRAVLEAYQRRLNGQRPKVEIPPATEHSYAQLMAAFVSHTGVSHSAWLEAWKADAVEDSAENWRTTMVAMALDRWDSCSPADRERVLELYG